MIPTSLTAALPDAPRILCLGAHSDDIEIGAGATLLALTERFPGARFQWVVFSGNGDRAQEARRSAAHILGKCDDPDIRILDFRDGYLQAEFAAIKETFESIREQMTPDIIFTHYRSDRHQDHRLISDITWQCYRNHLVLEYEIPKYDGDFDTPNLFNPVSDQLRLEKLEILETFFGSQRDRNWFGRETFNSIMRLRGIECNAPSGFAEAFYSRKQLLDFS